MSSFLNTQTAQKTRTEVKESTDKRWINNWSYLLRLANKYVFYTQNKTQGLQAKNKRDAITSCHLYIVTSCVVPYVTLSNILSLSLLRSPTAHWRACHPLVLSQALRIFLACFCAPCMFRMDQLAPLQTLIHVFLSLRSILIPFDSI